MFLITLLFLLSHDFITLLFFFNIFYFYKYYSKPQAQELSKTDEYFEETYLRILGLLN